MTPPFQDSFLAPFTGCLEPKVVVVDFLVVAAQRARVRALELPRQAVEKGTL